MVLDYKKLAICESEFKAIPGFSQFNIQDTQSADGFLGLDAPKGDSGGTLMWLDLEELKNEANLSATLDATVQLQDFTQTFSIIFHQRFYTEIKYPVVKLSIFLYIYFDKKKQRKPEN